MTAERRRRGPLLAIIATLSTVAMLGVLAVLLIDLGDATHGFDRARVSGTQTANAQRDVLIFRNSVMSLAAGGSVKEAELRRDLVLQQLRTLEQHSGADREALRDVERRVRDLDLASLARARDRPAAVTAVDRRLAAIERDFKAVHDAQDLEFQRATADALSARMSAQRLLGGLIVLTLLLGGAWALQTGRRSRGDLRRAHRAVRASEERFRSLVQNSSDLTVLADGSGTISYASPAAGTLTGLTSTEMEGLTLAALAHGHDRAAVERAIERLGSGNEGVAHFEFRVLHAGVGIRHLEATASNLLADPAVEALVFNIRDVTDRRRLEAELSHLAFHDPLTGLPNRALLAERIAHAAERARRRPRAGMALILIDLDDFKAVNDGLGHEEGDRLLVSVAERLRHEVRPGDTVARLGGDEFVVFCDDVASPDEACDLAGRLLAALVEPFEIGPALLPGRASVGVRYATGADAEPDHLLRDADLAMYSAKESGKGSWALFEPAMHVSASARLTLRADLHGALDRDELVLHYQPVVDLEDERVVGFEALARWQHPTHGLLGPDRFIGLAESSGMIDALGAWVVTEAAAAARRFQDAAGDHELAMSVNLSARQLERPDIADTVRGALAASGLPPQRLVLEVTESVFLAETEGVAERLEELRALGVELALDDFGTGFSSLGYLERLPLDMLKIDRSFVSTLTDAESHGALVATILRLTDVLGLRAVAEGVETDAQLQALRAMGCRHAQGYLFAKPLPERAALDLLQTRNLLPQP